MSFRSCHCCQEPGRVFVWIVSAVTVTKVGEGCVYIRRRYYGILPRVGGEFEHSALSPLSLSSLSLALSSNATTLNHLIRLRGSQGIQIWKQRTSPPLLCSFHPDMMGTSGHLRAAEVPTLLRHYTNLLTASVRSTLLSFVTATSAADLVTARTSVRLLVPLI